MVNAAKEAQNMTVDVAQKRKQHLAECFPQLNRGDFATEDAYRVALLTQHRQLRQQEYEYICLTEGTIAFDVAAQNNGDLNVIIWKCEKNLSDSTAYQKVRDILPEYCQNYGNHKKTKIKNGRRVTERGEYCCAASACGLEAAICERTGIEGLIKKDAANAGARNLAPFNNNLKVSGKGKNDLWKLIEDGKVGPGDQISRDSGGNTVSGRHAEVIIAVNYDEDGKLKNYIIQGNNRSRLQVIDANTTYPPSITQKIKGRKVTHPGNFTVGQMNTWMSEQLDRETDNMRTLPTAEIENIVNLQKDSTLTEIDDLSNAEHHLFGLQTRSTRLQKMIDNYAATYIRNSGIPEATSLAMEIDAQNAKGEEQRQTDLLRQQTVTHGEKPSKTLINPEMFAHKTNQYQ